MAHRITEDCLMCGVCVDKCPEGAIIKGEPIEKEGLILQPVSIDPEKCTDCGVCVEPFFCPAQAIIKDNPS